MVRSLLSSTALVLALSAVPAFAQTAAPAPAGTAPGTTAGENSPRNILEEVVITAARKRTEDVQSTPVAVTALNPDMIENAHVNSITQLGTLAPNLIVIQQHSAPDVATIYLRGFGQENNQPDVDPHVSIYLDGIYQPSLSGSALDAFDLGGIEIDAGPQGTLLGKNAPIGAVYVTSARPADTFQGAVQGEYGAYDHFIGRAKVDVPLFTDNAGSTILTSHLSFADKEGGNWVHDRLSNSDEEGGENEKVYRLGLLFTPSPDFEWLVQSSITANRTPQAPDRNVSSEHPGGIPGTPSSATQATNLECIFAPQFCAPTPYGTTDSPYTTRIQSDTVNLSSQITWRLTPVTLTSVTGLNTFWGTDATIPGQDQGPSVYANNKETHDFESEEFRISSNKGGGWDADGLLDWLVGGYASNEHFTFDENLAVLVPYPAPFNLQQGEAGTVQSEAVFAHVIANFTDQWTGTFGVRESWDQKRRNFYVGSRANYAASVPAGFHNTSFEVGTAYQFDQNHMAYVRFAEGYAAGGYSGFNLPVVQDIYQPEQNTAYEIGFKSDWFDKRLRVNVDVFLNELSNLQLSGVVPDPSAAEMIALVTTNAGSATVEGAEAQIVAVPIDPLTLHMTLGYLHPKYDKFFSTECTNNGLPGDCSGIPFSFASKWTMDLGAQYVYELPNSWGTETFSADWSYRSSLYTNDPPVPDSFQEGYGLVNLSATYADPTDTYSIEFFGTNVLDRHYKSLFANISLTQFQSDGAPAEWGMRLTYKFGQNS